MQDDPKIISSRLSGPVTRDGMTVDVQIYRLEGGGEWSLEVVDAEGASTVWDEQFPSDQEAHAEFLRTIKEEGMSTFLRDPSGKPN